MQADGELAPGIVKIFTTQKPGKGGRKYFTTIENLDQRLAFDRVLSDMKKLLGCSGTIVSARNGKIIQLDFHNTGGVIEEFLIRERLARPTDFNKE